VRKGKERKRNGRARECVGGVERVGVQGLLSRVDGAGGAGASLENDERE